MIGIIGGMGPVATSDFFRKLIEAVPARDDDDHVPVLIHSVPQLPSRPAAILDGAASPLPDLLKARDRLLEAGAQAIAMPCNTAHYWYADLAAGCPVPFLHIADAVGEDLAALGAAGRDVGIVATRATLAGGVYTPLFRRLGCRMLEPTPAEYDALVAPGIAAVKSSRLGEAGALLEPAVRKLLERGAIAVVLACTEVPAALDAVGSPLRPRAVDSNAALARACVRWWRGRAG